MVWDWFGPGRAVWVSHPGQVGDRAGQGRAVVRQYAAGQVTSRVWAGRQAVASRQVLIAEMEFGISRREKKARIIAVT